MPEKLRLSWNNSAPSPPASRNCERSSVPRLDTSSATKNACDIPSFESRVCSIGPVTPEPSSISLLLIGLLGIWLGSRKRIIGLHGKPTRPHTLKLEYRLDRLFPEKLAQAYQLLVPEQRRPTRRAASQNGEMIH